MPRKRNRSIKQSIKPVPSATEAALTRVSDPLPVREEVHSLAGDGLRSAATMVREHPRATVGALLGVGVLVGAVAHRAFQREPSLGDLLLRSLGRRLEQLNHAALLGLQFAVSPLRKALR